MTLVVARIKNDHISVVADTQILVNGDALPREMGLVKSCILSNGLCVSFSGSPELATRDIWNFHAKHPAQVGFSDAVSYFEKSSRSTKNEYILAFARSSKIVKITNGKRADSVSKTQWIGDYDAYKEFRGLETRLRKRLEEGRAISAVFLADEPEHSPARL